MGSLGPRPGPRPASQPRMSTMRTATQRTRLTLYRNGRPEEQPSWACHDTPERAGTYLVMKPSSNALAICWATVAIQNEPGRKKSREKKQGGYGKCRSNLPGSSALTMGRTRAVLEPISRPDAIWVNLGRTRLPWSDHLPATMPTSHVVPSPI